MRTKKIIIGNWKMNPLTLKEADKLLGTIAKNIPGLRKTEAVVCPPYIFLDKLKKATKKISLGSQDAFWGDTGAFTGEVSAEMLGLFGIPYAIIGHSERRARGETNSLVAKKIRSVLAAGMRPVLCVGESERDREHSYFQVVKSQLEESLKGVPKNSIGKVLIAYEPVWAISSTPDRRDATPADLSEMVIFIRKVISDKFGKDATATRILYGGSVNDRDAEDFLRQGGVDGLLVGRASLDAHKLAKIIGIAEKI